MVNPIKLLKSLYHTECTLYRLNKVAKRVKMHSKGFPNRILTQVPDKYCTKMNIVRVYVKKPHSVMDLNQ
jgi:hypothetical protein